MSIHNKVTAIRKSATSDPGSVMGKHGKPFNDSPFTKSGTLSHSMSNTQANEKLNSSPISSNNAGGFSEQYFEGQEAARQGLNDADCPYPIGSDEAIDWQDGLASKQ